MPRPLLRLGQVLMLLVLFAAAGGHWMALQSLAWTNMLLSYSQNGTFVDAVAKTFDGRHPCGLCKKIEQAGQGEQTPQTLQQENQVHFVIPSAVAIVLGEPLSWKLEISDVHSSGRVEQPATPPPRSAAV